MTRRPALKAAAYVEDGRAVRRAENAHGSVADEWGGPAASMSQREDEPSNLAAGEGNPTRRGKERGIGVQEKTGKRRRGTEEE